MSELSVLAPGCLLAIVLVAIAGIYCLLISRNLIRILIGLELLTKAVTFLIVLAGVATGKVSLSQSLIITLIVVEVVVIAVAAGVVIASYQHTESLDTKALEKLKG